MRKLIFSVVTALFCSFGTATYSFTLEGIVEQCHIWSKTNFSYDLNKLAPFERFNVGVCIGYMSAFKDAGIFNCALKKGNLAGKFPAFNFHENYNTQQLAQLTLNFKRDNPEKWKHNPADLAFDMLPNGKCN